MTEQLKENKHNCLSDCCHVHVLFENTKLGNVRLVNRLNARHVYMYNRLASRTFPSFVDSDEYLNAARIHTPVTCSTFLLGGSGPFPHPVALYGGDTKLLTNYSVR